MGIERTATRSRDGCNHRHPTVQFQLSLIVESQVLHRTVSPDSLPVERRVGNWNMPLGIPGVFSNYPEVRPGVAPGGQLQFPVFHIIQRGFPH